MENPKFTLFKGADVKFYFNLKAKNGERILQSEGYNTKQGCLMGIFSVKNNAPYDGRYDRKTTTNAQYYFVLKAENGQAIGVSEMYTSAQGRDNGIEAVKHDAPNAPIEDLA